MFIFEQGISIIESPKGIVGDGRFEEVRGGDIAYLSCVN